MRKLEHKVGNCMSGVEKKVDFSGDVRTMEFSSEKPVNGDLGKNRNFILLNKKRMRSRSIGEKKKKKK